MNTKINLLAVLVSLLLIIGACSSEESGSAEQQMSSQNETEQPKAPNFEVTTIEGDTVSLQQSLDEDKPLVVYFTASWCPICAKNWPVLSKLYPEYKDRLNLVAIGIDPTDDEETMRKLADEENFTFPITKGYPEVMRDFGVQSQATTVGVNTDGTIAFQKNKTALSEEEYRELFDGLLN
ncbi:peroxiredoxin family protein [Fodinibius sp.]|uniref:peroxiredoxin family protein n=1 Tax=Fodinibius sp. TaxID=1872440 RepID=UPI002ACE8100|nr:peroxiredoxin family protein [Fodinibius sp.]MDZ7659023.1 peroxiredoxin family protein [Fodinibius sp.]